MSGTNIPIPDPVLNTNAAIMPLSSDPAAMANIPPAQPMSNPTTIPMQSNQPPQLNQQEIEDRKIRLDERRIALDELKERNRADLELRKEIFAENQSLNDFNRLVKQSDQHWLQEYWRPAAAWVYLIICLMDFVVFPLLAMFTPVIEKSFGINMPYTAWIPITLSNGGLIHVAFGGIIGISAWSRGQENITRATALTGMNTNSPNN